MSDVILSQSTYEREMIANIQRCWHCTQKLAPRIDESKHHRIPEGDATLEKFAQNANSS